MISPKVPPPAKTGYLLTRKRIRSRLICSCSQLSALRAEGRFLLASTVEDVQDVDRLPSLLIIDEVFSDGKATDLRGNVADGLARQGMFGESLNLAVTRSIMRSATLGLARSAQ
jgi:hypothetical protein